jgi:Meiotically up-regulated gene 113
MPGVARHNNGMQRTRASASLSSSLCWRSPLMPGVRFFYRVKAMVYFIQAGVNGEIKIGFAIEPWKRIKQLQTGNHVRLTMLKVIPGDRKRETQIHHLLSVHRKHGDWFHPTVEVLEFIKKLDDVEYEVQGVRAYAVLRRDTEESETDPCPFCGRGHVHGKGDGHRVAHCADLGAREEIRAKDGIRLRQSDGYLIRTRWKGE